MEILVGYEGETELWATSNNTSWSALEQSAESFLVIYIHTVG
jgi:hypothetical protein